VSILAIPIVLSLLNATPTVEIRTTNGLPLTGTIAEFSVARIALQTPSGRRSLAIEQLVGLSIVQPAESLQQSKVRIALTDGSTLRAVEYTVRNAQATVTLSGGKTLGVPTEQINNVRFAPEGDTRAEWARILGGGSVGDRLVVRKGDTLDEHQGIMRDVTAGEVRFEVDGDVLPVKRPRVAGLIYYHAARPMLPEPACWISDVDGSRWPAQSVALDGPKLRWTTPAGLALVRPIVELKQIDFSGGKIVYLSDLTPESIQWTPYLRPDKELPILNEFFAPRQDLTLGMQPLKLGGKPYRKGLAIHSRTELVYRLPDRFRRFQAMVGIDDRLRPQGVMRLVIRSDQRVLLAASVTGGDAPLSVDLDLTGVRRLAIVADFAGGLDVGDHLLLCDARVIK